MKKIFTVLLNVMLLMIFSLPATFAAQTKDLGKIIVTATKTPTAVKEIASSFTVIGKEDIERSKAQTVEEVLRFVPGLDVVQTGGLGKTTSVYIRGANNQHTLVLVDGVEMNYPISAGRTFNFADLLADDIESIEIIRGPQSTLYGSDAMGGVINIITKKGEKGFQPKLGLEIGSHNTMKENFSLSGGTDKGQYFANISRLDSQGISMASEKLGNREDDGYENTTATTNISYDLTDKLKVKSMVRYDDFSNDIDNGAGAGKDDINHTIEGYNLYSNVKVGHTAVENRWLHDFNIGYAKHKRDDNNDPDIDHPSNLLRSTFKSNLLQLDWQHTITPNEYNTVIAGLEYEKEKGENSSYSESSFGSYTSNISEKSITNKAIYIQDQIKIADKFYPTIGLRYDDHSKFGNETTYKVGAAYLVDKTNSKIKFSYATAFKAPSLYQLYSSYGDETLNPEKCKGFDIGLEQFLLNDKIFIELSYFHNDFDNLIDYNYNTSSYQNVSKAKTSGVEFGVGVKAAENLQVNATYTYTDTEDKDKQQELLRRAKNKFNIILNYQCTLKLNLNLDLKYVGQRKMNDYSVSPSVVITKGGYGLVDFVVAYKINTAFEVFAKVLNVFARDYEEVDGYGALGRTFWGGVKAEF